MSELKLHKNLAELCSQSCWLFGGAALRAFEYSSGRVFGESELSDAQNMKLPKCKVCYCQSPNLIKSRDKF